MKVSDRIIALFTCFVIIFSMLTGPFVAHADLIDGWNYGVDSLKKWFDTGSSEWVIVDWADALFSSNKSQKYYTTPTSSVQDKNGNVTNYYRGGDTTDMRIIDSYNKTFNTIHNTTNNTNNYKANVRLSDFLNNYTTNNITNTTNNQYTYSADFNTWLKCTQCQGQIEIQIKR
jgi:hypothetical protein